MNRKNVLVTGSSRGIGRACALSFAKNGYHVFINCKSSLTQLRETEKEIEKANPMEIGVLTLAKD